MPVSPAGTFTRIWKFVDQFLTGDDITRADLDIAMDDLATGINDTLVTANSVATLKDMLDADTGEALLLKQLTDTHLNSIALHARSLERRVEGIL